MEQKYTPEQRDEQIEHLWDFIHQLELTVQEQKREINTLYGALDSVHGLFKELKAVLVFPEFAENELSDLAETLELEE